MSMKPQDFLERNRVAPSIDALALYEATSPPRYELRGDFLSNAIGWLAGAPQAANNAGSYYQKAMDQVYGNASGPFGGQYTGLVSQSMQPFFQSQDEQLQAAQAAQGITRSGAALKGKSDLGASQAATLAGAIAPFFQQAQGIAGGIAGEEPGAQNSAYQNALQNFYSAIGAFAGGIPSGGGSSVNPVYTGNPATTSTDVTYSNPYGQI